MRTTLVTGGAGFIGSHLTERLLRGGDRVIVLDDLSTGCLSNLPREYPRLEVVRASVLDEAVVSRLVREADRVFHLAAAVGVGMLAADPVSVVETNVGGTSVVLRACASHRRPMLFASSSEVYGKTRQVPFPESADFLLGPPNRPRWSYACSKAMGEYLALAHFRRNRLPVVVVRIFNTTGPRQSGRFGMVIPRFVEQALSGRPITVYGDGRQRRCFCHVEDMTAALQRLMETPRSHGATVNVGGADSIAIGALARRIKYLTESESEIVQIPFDEAYEAGFEDILDRKPDLRRAGELIGYRPTFSLDQILQSAIDYARRIRPSRQPGGRPGFAQAAP